MGVHHRPAPADRRSPPGGAARPTEPLVDHDLPAGSPDDDPEGTTIAAIEAQAAVDRIVAALTPDQAEVVLLRVLGGLPVAQVADVLGKEPSAVRVLQHRALRRLAQHFPEGTDW